MPRSLQVDHTTDYQSRRADADAALKAIRTSVTCIDATLLDMAHSMAAVDDMVPPYPPIFVQYAFQEQHHIFLQRAKEHAAKAAGMLVLYNERLNCLTAEGQGATAASTPQTTDTGHMHCLEMDAGAHGFYGTEV